MDFKNYKFSMVVYTILGITIIWNLIYSYFESFITKSIPLPLQNPVLSISVVTLIFLLFGIYDHWLWKKIPYLINVRNVSGRYEGHLQSNYNKFYYDIVIEIIQTASTIEVTQYTKNKNGVSTSNSFNAQLILGKNNLYNLNFYYRNEGDEVQDELDSHDGFCKLKFDIERNKIVGTYFTNRKIQTKGKIEVNKTGKKILGGFYIC